MEEVCYEVIDGKNRVSIPVSDETYDNIASLAKQHNLSFQDYVDEVLSKLIKDKHEISLKLKH